MISMSQVFANTTLSYLNITFKLKVSTIYSEDLLVRGGDCKPVSVCVCVNGDLMVSNNTEGLTQ